MAPTLTDTLSLAKRQFGYGYGNNCGYYDNCYSRWNSWGRWVVLAAIVVAAILAIFALACINARRRRRMGMNPRYGTGWAAGKTPYGHSGPQYTNAPYYPQPAPPYTAPAQYNATGNSNTGYYGQESGVELQPPQNAHVSRAGENVYAAPEGPPPTKGDGIIR